MRTAQTVVVVPVALAVLATDDLATALNRVAAVLKRAEERAAGRDETTT